MRVFIGSSKEKLDYAEDIACYLESIDVEPVLWNDDNAFPLGAYTWQQLSDIAHSVDAAVFIFAADDKTWFRGEARDSVRDNVILEYGLFSGVLSSDNVCFIRSQNADVPSDLSGITYAAIERKNTVKRKLRTWVGNIKSKETTLKCDGGAFDLVSLGTAFSMVIQKQKYFDKLRVFAISSFRSATSLRTHNNEIHIDEAIILLREFTRKDKYYQKEMKETIEHSIEIWEKMRDLGVVETLSLYRFDFHPTTGFYIFDDKFIVFGHLSYDIKTKKYEFEDRVILIDASTESGRHFINESINYFDRLVSNYDKKDD